MCVSIKCLRPDFLHRATWRDFQSRSFLLGCHDTFSFSKRKGVVCRTGDLTLIGLVTKDAFLAKLAWRYLRSKSAKLGFALSTN